MKNSTVCVVGLGYVGLTTAACFASKRIHVLGIDVDEGKVGKIRQGEPVFKEKDLAPLLDRGLRSGFLEVQAGFSGVREGDITFVAVGTPSSPDGSIDTTYAEVAAREVGRALRSTKRFHAVVIKSTVVPGTTNRKLRPIIETEAKMKAGEGFGLGVNPEFLFEGSAVRDMMNPEALVLGTSDKRTMEMLVALYRRFYRRLPRSILTTPENAELIKYAVNSFRAVQVSYVNFLANICTRIEGGEIGEVVKGLRQVARMDKRYLGAGLGFGGSCLPKDSRALEAMALSVGVDPAVLSSAIRTNGEQAREVVGLAKKLVGDLAGKRVAVLGLAFKAGTDDVRESTAFGLIEILRQEDATVSVYDPAAMENAKALLGNRVNYAPNPKQCISGADVCIVATGWNDFKEMKPALFKKLMRTPAVVDGRRIFEPNIFRRGGVPLLRVGTASAETISLDRWRLHYTQPVNTN